MPTPAELGRLLKQKYAGKYDDVADDKLGNWAINKYGSADAAINDSPTPRWQKVWEGANTPFLPTFEDKPISTWGELPVAAGKEMWNAAAGMATPLMAGLGVAGRMKSLGVIPVLANVGLMAGMVKGAAERTGGFVKTIREQGVTPESVRQGIGAATSVGMAALPTFHTLPQLPGAARAIGGKAQELVSHAKASKLYWDERGELGVDVTPTNIKDNATALALRTPWFKFAIEDFLSKRMGGPDRPNDPSDILRMIKDPKNQVKQGDIYWNKFDEWLNGKVAKNQKVTFNEAMDYLYKNGVSVQVQRRTIKAADDPRYFMKPEQIENDILQEKGLTEEYTQLNNRLDRAGSELRNAITEADYYGKLCTLFTEARDGENPQRRMAFAGMKAAMRADGMVTYSPWEMADSFVSLLRRGTPKYMDWLKKMSRHHYGNITKLILDHQANELDRDRYATIKREIREAAEKRIAQTADEMISVDTPARWLNYGTIDNRDTYRMITSRVMSLQHRMVNDIDKEIFKAKTRLERSGLSQDEYAQLQQEYNSLKTRRHSVAQLLPWQYVPAEHLTPISSSPESFADNTAVHVRGDFRTLEDGRKSWTGHEVQPDMAKDYAAYGSKDPESPISKEADESNVQRLDRELEEWDKRSAAEAQANHTEAVEKIKKTMANLEAQKARIKKRQKYAEEHAAYENRAQWNSPDRPAGASQTLEPYSVSRAPFIDVQEKINEVGMKAWIKNALTREPDNVPDVIGFVDGYSAGILQGYGTSVRQMIIYRLGEAVGEGGGVWDITTHNGIGPTSGWGSILYKRSNHSVTGNAAMYEKFRHFVPLIEEAWNKRDTPEMEALREQVRAKIDAEFRASYRPYYPTDTWEAASDAEKRQLRLHPEDTAKAVIIDFPERVAIPREGREATFWGLYTAYENNLKLIQKMAKKWKAPVTRDHFYDRPAPEAHRAGEGEYWQYSIPVTPEMRAEFEPPGRTEISPLIPLGVGIGGAALAWKVWHTLSDDDKEHIKASLNDAGLSLASGLPLLATKAPFFQSRVKDSVASFPQRIKGIDDMPGQPPRPITLPDGSTKMVGGKPPTLGRTLKEQVLFMLKGKGMSENEIWFSNIEQFLDEAMARMPEKKSEQVVTKEQLAAYLETPNPLRGIEVIHKDGNTFLYDHPYGQLITQQAPWFVRAAHEYVQPDSYKVSLLKFPTVTNDMIQDILDRAVAANDYRSPLWRERDRLISAQSHEYAGQGLQVEHFYAQDGSERNYFAHCRWGLGKNALGETGRIVLEYQHDWLQQHGHPSTPRMPIPMPRKVVDLNLLWILKDAHDSGQKFVAFPKDPTTIERLQVWDQWGGIEQNSEGRWTLSSNREDVTPVVHHYTREVPEWFTKNGKKYGVTFGPEEIVRADGRREVWNVARFAENTSLKHSIPIPSIFLPLAGVAAGYAAYKALVDDKNKMKDMMWAAVPFVLSFGKPLGQSLKEYRVANRLGARSLEIEAGVPPTTIKKIESGEFVAPKHRAALARRLGVPPEELAHVPQGAAPEGIPNLTGGRTVGSGYGRKAEPKGSTPIQSRPFPLKSRGSKLWVPGAPGFYRK